MLCRTQVVGEDGGLAKMTTLPDSITIRTGARLHFGLLDCKPPFGGLGLMIDSPATEVEAVSDKSFAIDSSIESAGLAARTKAIASRAAKHFRCGEADEVRLPPIKLKLKCQPPKHSGFGSGTQYSLAIAEACCRAIAFETVPEETMVIDIAGRARRSAVGAHGYLAGGLIYETNDDCSPRLNPIAKRIDLPRQWRVLLVRPRKAKPAVAGADEQRRFDQLRHDRKRTEMLIRLVEDEVMPAAARQDFHGFSEAIERYNRESGLLFASIQGGPYNGTAVNGAIDRLKQLGAVGVGQSSWGPTVFAWCEDRSRADSLASSLSGSDWVTLVTTAKAGGRTLTTPGQ
ncbi:beta-ribofuranosylaminobenzene 5'-phosphate synthase [Roseiconus lacunae]|uniref:Beta-ribofuranosylaminobenzene 5'-phosphate synthase n=1 Tax=Roseiconus lacunae TaxID=2605694 RepID=A0ABT7PHT0_9BACT|nr:beta-ribofuranosylaminobenzene 5'-phosphate synthase [Roseiconus lacunae]MCD0461233.1 beta-ribofuranosylaminobenzene 5'-phosphate synthase [Roseiconus lacunae]MDM4016059.1 beta-ribofuranosylaminobenzene 5'-phosphate synthase [Roseiconus lacunae]